MLFKGKEEAEPQKRKGKGGQIGNRKAKAGAPPPLEKRRKNLWFETQLYISIFLPQKESKKLLSSENALVLFVNHSPSLAPNERLTLCLANTYTNTLTCQTHTQDRSPHHEGRDGRGVKRHKDKREDLEHKLDLVLKLGLNVFLADGLLPAMELLQVTFHLLPDSATSRRDFDGQIFRQGTLKVHFANGGGNLEVRVLNTSSFVEHVFGGLDLSWEVRERRKGREEGGASG